jgi:hypothetical protein
MNFESFNMRVIPKDISGPVPFKGLPQEIQAISNSLLDGLKVVLNDYLWGIYLYGAMVFPETRYIQDIDFHVILNRNLTHDEKERVKALHRVLSIKFPRFKDELDGYYILLSDARQISTPWHQIYPDIPDESWSLHIAHMRAGYCIVLYGPEPKSFLPEPTWEDLVFGLDAALKHTLKYLDTHPDYCMLNFCRILYSFSTKNVVVSKRRAAEWIQEQFPGWSQLTGCALRVFEREERKEDRNLLQSKTREFYQFLCRKIEEFC